MQVDFYLLEQAGSEQQFLFACRLIEKAYGRGHRVYIQCQDQLAAESLDDLLWCYKDDSFIPHNLQGEGPTPPPPVQIGFNDAPTGFHDILINLSHEVPSFNNQFKRVIEIVTSDEETKARTRDHFRHYRKQGHPPKTHKIST